MVRRAVWMAGWVLGFGLAQGPARADDAQRAQVHFQHAKELYQQGNYKEARKELEEAHDLDPAAKDLVFNLGIVCEKLDRIDDAIRYFKMYLDMDLDSNERARAETTVKRLEGAKKTRPKEVTPPPNTAPPTVITTTQSIGRVDGWTITSASLAVIGLGVFAGAGIGALASRPPAGFVTGKDGSYADLKAKADSAHTLAIVADVGLIAGAVFTVATAFLFFARKQDPKRGSNAPPITATPFGVGGTF